MAPNGKRDRLVGTSALLMSALALIMCARSSPRGPVANTVRARGVAEVKRPGPAELRELRRRLASLEEKGELLVEAGTVGSGEAVPLPNGGTWRDGSPIPPENWVIAVSPADVPHTWRGTPKATRCCVDQDTRVVRVYSEKWTYPGEGVDQQGRASYLIVCSRQLGRSAVAVEPEPNEVF